eukprot:8749110-Ditylum_brightwellii.AAC.1
MDDDFEMDGDYSSDDEMPELIPQGGYDYDSSNNEDDKDDSSKDKDEEDDDNDTNNSLPKHYSE